MQIIKRKDGKRLTLEERQEERAKGHIQALAQVLTPATQQADLALLGPYPSLPYRRRGAYRWQLVLKTKDVLGANALVRAALEKLKLYGQVKADVDPQGLMG